MATNKEKEELKQRIQVWLQIEKEKTKLKEQLKERDKQQKAIEPTIIDFMSKTGHNVLSLGDETVRSKTVKQYQGLNRELITNTLAKLIKDENKAAEYTDAIYGSRKMVEKTTLLKKPKPSDD